MNGTLILLAFVFGAGLGCFIAFKYYKKQLKKIKNDVPVGFQKVIDKENHYWELRDNQINKAKGQDEPVQLPN